jgi:hypothetical protein
MATNPTEAPRDPWWFRSPTWLLFGLFLAAIFALVVSVVLAAAYVAGDVAGAIVDEWEDFDFTRSADTTTVVADKTVIGPSVCMPEGFAADGWITDQAGLVKSESDLEQIAATEAAHNNVVAVVLVQDSGSCSPDEFAVELASIWSVGDPARFASFVVLVDNGEGRTVVVTGPDTRVSNELLRWAAALSNDHFAAGDFDSGILAIMGGLRGIQADISIRPHLDADRTVLLSEDSGVDRLNLVGSARDSDGAISLTRKAEGLHQTGAAWFSDQVTVGEGFESQFVFEIDHISWYTIGDGFAFVIQSTGSAALGEAASGNGYEDIPSSVAVEFDTVYHDYKADPKYPVPGDGPPGLLTNHVAVHSRGVEPNSANGQAIVGSVGLQDVLLYDRRHHMALVRYTPGTLSVFLDDFEVPVLTVELDLNDLLNLDDDDSAYIGFTAGTEPGFYSDFLVHGWTFDRCNKEIDNGARCISNR